MSSTQARQTRAITKKFTAQLTGRAERGADRRVRRGSYDVGDRRAQVFRPIGDGTTAGALGWIDSLLKVVAEWDDVERRKGGGRPLGLHGQRVLETLLGRRGAIAPDFRTGCIEPALDTIARVARVSRTTVVRALARLKAMGILSWVRRTQRTDNAGGYGPQREQVSNAYFFTPESLPVRALQRLRDLMARRRLRATGAAPESLSKGPNAPSSPELRAALERMRVGIERRDGDPDASPPSGQYPSSGVQG